MKHLLFLTRICIQLNYECPGNGGIPQMIKSMVRFIAGIILYDDHKYKRIKFILSAYFDGLKGKFDNNKPKRILYGK